MAEMIHSDGPCVIEHAGKSFTSGGAEVNEVFCFAYLEKDGKLVSWHGAVLGTYTVTSSWPTPHSYVSSRMHQVVAVVQGRTYTGRSPGVGMYFRGKRVARELKEGK